MQDIDEKEKMLMDEAIEETELEESEEDEEDEDDEVDSEQDIDETLSEEDLDENKLNRNEFSPSFFNNCRDNSVEWYTGQTIVTCTFSQRKWINKIKRLAEKHPEEVNIQFTHSDCIVVKMPISYIKISPPKKVSEEQRERMRLQAQKNIAEGKFGKRKKAVVTEENNAE